jgi:hypothetical protein
MDKKNEKIELFVHSEGVRPKPVKIETTDTLAKLLEKAGIETKQDLLVFCGESKSALQEQDGVEHGEDEHEPVKVDSIIDGLKLKKNSHVHCYRCRRIEVTVNYQNKTKHHKFSPATTVETVRKWALKKFHLTDVDAEKLVLEICDTNERPRATQYLGELVQYPNCSICFNLVPDVKIEG